MARKVSWITLAIAVLMLLVGSVLAAVPQLMNYQGKLTDANGNPIDGTVSIVFSIYPDSTGGTALWTETQPTVTVTSGLFNVLLGSVNAIPDSIFDGSTRWLGIKVGIDPEMTPRQRIVSVGYAYRATKADTAEYARNAGEGQIIYDVIVAPSGGDYTDIGSAIAAGKKKLFIKSGTYTLSSHLSLPDNTLLQGEDWDNTVVTGGYLVTGGSNSVVRDIKFTNTGWPGGIELTGVNNIFDHIKIQGTRDGIYIGNHGRITRCHVVCDVNTIVTGDSCVIRDSYLDGGICQIHNYCIVTGNIVKSTGTTRGIGTDGGCSITQNHVICLAAFGIGIAADAGSRVIGNYVEGFATGIDLDGANEEGGICQGNIVKGSGIKVWSASNPGYGYVIVEGNRVHDSIGTGFYLWGPKILCSNNAVYSAGSDGFYGLNTWEAIVSDNYAEGCSGVGFNFSDDLANSAFTGNVAYQNSGDGFHINADFSTFTGNVAYFNGGNGFKIDAWRSVINSNNAYNNTIYGFNWVGGSDCTVVGNLSKGNNSGNWNGSPSGQVGLNNTN